MSRKIKFTINNSHEESIKIPSQNIKNFDGSSFIINALKSAFINVLNSPLKNKCVSKIQSYENFKKSADDIVKELSKSLKIPAKQFNIGTTLDDFLIFLNTGSFSIKMDNTKESIKLYENILELL